MNRAHLASAQRQAVTPDLHGIGDRWEDLELEQKRAVIKLVLERVEVARGRRGSRFDPSRVNLVWRA